VSKGSNQRPGTGYADNWDRIFGRKAKSEQALQELTDLSQELGLYDDPYTFDLFWHAINYRTASTPDAPRCWDELVACVNRLIAREECA
jgi:hypothetical protein